MKFKKSRLDGVFEIFPRLIEDERGYFFESYNHEVFKAHGINTNYLQDNQSKSKKGVLRGLHFQTPPHGQEKLVRVLQGAIMDVAVDLRKDSPTYGQHAKFKLTASQLNMVLVPEGFAHGFVTLEDNTIVCYKCSGLYNKNAEQGLLWNDPDLNIDWECDAPLVSEKDQNQLAFKDFKSPF